MFERNTINIKEAGGGMLQSEPVSLSGLHSSDNNFTPTITPNEPLMPRSHCGISLPVSPDSSGTWRNVMHTMRSVIQMGTNSMEWQEAGSVSICIAPFNTNMVKRDRGVKSGQNGSRTRLIGLV